MLEMLTDEQHNEFKHSKYHIIHSQPSGDWDFVDYADTLAECYDILKYWRDRYDEDNWHDKPVWEITGSLRSGEYVFDDIESLCIRQARVYIAKNVCYLPKSKRSITQNEGE